MELTEEKFSKLIDVFNDLVEEEYELGIGDLGELREEIEESEDGFLLVPHFVTKSGEEELINLKGL